MVYCWQDLDCPELPWVWCFLPEQPDNIAWYTERGVPV